MGSGAAVILAWRGTTTEGTVVAQACVLWLGPGPGLGLSCEGRAWHWHVFAGPERWARGRSPGLAGWWWLRAAPMENVQEEGGKSCPPAREHSGLWGIVLIMAAPPSSVQVQLGDPASLPAPRGGGGPEASGHAERVSPHGVLAKAAALGATHSLDWGRGARPAGPGAAAACLGGKLPEGGLAWGPFTCYSSARAPALHPLKQLVIPR